MMECTHVVSGSASGIGAATAALLREQGHRVIGVDLRDADVVHGVVPCAGVAVLTGVDPAMVVSVNYFGALGLVRGLQPELAAAGSELFVDGGTDAMMHPEVPVGWEDQAAGPQVSSRRRGQRRTP